MAAMLPSGGGGGRGNPYAHYDNPSVDDDLVDPDDGIRCPTPPPCKLAVY